MNDKFKAEDQFLDQAWTNMRDMLDQEMPIMPTAPKRSKKAYGMLLLLWVVGFGAGVSSILLWQQKMEQSSPVEPASNIPIAGIKDSPTSPTVIKSNEVPKLFAESKMDKTTSKQAADKPLIKDPVAINQSAVILKNASLNFVSTKKTTSDYNSTLTNTASNITLAVVTELQNETILKNPIALESKAFTSFENSNLQILALQSAEFDGIAEIEKEMAVVNLLAPAKKKISINWGMLAALHSEPSKGFGGYSLGLIVNAEVDRKFGISTGLMFSRFQFNDIVLNDAPDAFDLNQNDGQPGVYNEVTETPYQVRSDNASSSAIRLGSANYISIPLLLTYKTSRMLRVNMGVEYFRMLSASSNKITSNASQDYVASYKWYENSGYYGDLLNKTNFTALFGVSLQANEKFGFDLRYNHGFSDLSKNKGQFSAQGDTRESLQFSIMYSFGKRM